MRQTGCPSECAQIQPVGSASQPKSRGYTFTAQAFGGLASVRFDAISQECRRQPERVGDFFDGIKSWMIVRSALDTEHCIAVTEPGSIRNAVETQVLACSFQTHSQAKVQRISTTTNHGQSVARSPHRL